MYVNTVVKKNQLTKKFKDKEKKPCVAELCLCSEWAKGYSNEYTHKTSLSAPLRCTSTRLLWEKHNIQASESFPLAGYLSPLCWKCVTLLYTKRWKGRRREFIILELLLSLAGERERARELQIGQTCFLLTYTSLQYLLCQRVMNRPDQGASWLVKQGA